MPKNLHLTDIRIHHIGKILSQYINNVTVNETISGLHTRYTNIVQQMKNTPESNIYTFNIKTKKEYKVLNYIFKWHIETYNDNMTVNIYKNYNLV